MLELTPSMLSGLPRNGATDPIEYYRRPLVGRLFRERINLGLRLLPDQRFERALEVGYGAGAVQIALAPAVSRLSGIDLDADPGPATRLLESRGLTADLVQGSVYELPYEAEAFDLVVSFSVFEHLHEYRKGLSEVARVLRPGGYFLLGMPSVNRMMEAAFLAIGFRGIGHHHVTAPAQVEAEFAASGFRVERRATLDVPLKQPLGVPVYHDWLLRRRPPETRKAKGRAA